MQKDYSDKLKLLNQIRFKEYKNKQEIINKVKSLLQPEVEQAMRKLINQLSTLDSVRLYSERLQSQKVKDKIEQKKHEKQRLREELGSEYESSEEESNLFDEFGEKGFDEDNNSSQDNQLNDKKQKFFNDLNQFDNNEDFSTQQKQENVMIMTNVIDQEQQQEQGNIPLFNLMDLPQVKQKFQVAGIQEESENDDEQLSFKNNFRDKFLEHQLQLFNPLKFLGKTIKEIIGKSLDEDEEDEFEPKKENEEEKKEEQGEEKKIEENNQDK